ncbi:hypothetical protein D9M72_538890 [compost metagenome]
MAILRQCLLEVRAAAAAREARQSKYGATTSLQLLYLHDAGDANWHPMPDPEPSHLEQAADPAHPPGRPCRCGVGVEVGVGVGV